MSEQPTKILATGPAWMGRGIGSIEAAMRRLFREAQEDISMTGYSMGNADLLLEWMETSLTRGVQIKFIYNKLDRLGRNLKNRLDYLSGNYGHFQLYNFSDKKTYDLHAKAIVADRRIAIVGSSNLSTGGMLGNHELAVQIEGAPAAKVAKVLERLFRSSYATLITGPIP